MSFTVPTSHQIIKIPRFIPKFHKTTQLETHKPVALALYKSLNFSLFLFIPFFTRAVNLTKLFNRRWIIRQVVMIQLKSYAGQNVLF